jgi:cytochrome P450
VERAGNLRPVTLPAGRSATLRFSYIPFSIGPRTCIGAQFALTELVLILAALVRSFRIELAERRTVRPIGIVSTRPENPPPFLLRLRNDKAALFSR